MNTQTIKYIYVTYLLPSLKFLIIYKIVISIVKWLANCYQGQEHTFLLMPLSNKTNSKILRRVIAMCWQAAKTKTMLNGIGYTRYGSTNHSLGHLEGCRGQGANTALRNRLHMFAAVVKWNFLSTTIWWVILSVGTGNIYLN